VTVDGHGAQVAADVNDVRSQETYIGYARADTFASKGGIKRDTEHSYTEPAHVQLNEWGLSRLLEARSSSGFMPLTCILFLVPALREGLSSTG
jgi:hypothetical protein